MSATVMPHPCAFPQPVLDAFDRLLPDVGWVLDPFAGIGRIHQLATPTRRTVGVELETEWAQVHPDTIVGDATALPFPDSRFDAVATSPAYGNRMADNYDGRDGTRRFTYRLSLGRPLSGGSGAAMQWGHAYRDLHRRAVAEMVRVVRPGGLVLVNMKNHRRTHQEQQVVEWWAGTLAAVGCAIRWVEPILTSGIGLQAHRDTEIMEKIIVAEIGGER